MPAPTPNPLPPPPPSAPTRQERRAFWCAALVSAIGSDAFDEFETAEEWADQALVSFDKRFNSGKHA